jgi:hypothetical protein
MIFISLDFMENLISFLRAWDRPLNEKTEGKVSTPVKREKNLIPE